MPPVMDDETLARANKAQADQIRELQAQMADLMARVPAPPAPDTGEPKPWPRMVYKAAETPGQIDHPGWIHATVRDEEDFHAHLEEGWLERPGAYDYSQLPEPLVAPAPAPRAVKKGSRK